MAEESSNRASNTEYPWQTIFPTSDKQSRNRRIILCFDGIRDQSREHDSTLVQFFSALQKGDPNQLVYYEAGLLRAGNLFYSTISKTLDFMLSNNTNHRIMSGYNFLMQNYKDRDAIFIFGMSRGAQTAYALADMICRIGLLPAGNEQQVPFAFKMYKNDSEIGRQQHSAFKRTFAKNVRIEFVGLWDTAASIGLSSDMLPFTRTNTDIKVLRIALLLDERTRKVRPGVYQCMSLEDVEHVSLEHEESDVLEVWFAGCNRDATSTPTRNTLARVPLRWMIRECFLVKTGIQFKADHLCDLGLGPMKLYSRETSSSNTENLDIPGQINIPLATPQEPFRLHMSQTAEDSCHTAEPFSREAMTVEMEGVNNDSTDNGSDHMSDIAPAILKCLQLPDLTGKVFFDERKVISLGGYGDIFKANYHMDGCGPVTVCAKRLRFYLKEDIITLFEREIYVWSTLKHPNILPLLGYTFDDQTGYPVLVSSWLSNGSAWNFVMSHPECDLIRLITGIAKGVAYLHECGVIHSDIKSDNILVTESGDAALCDFGCSRMLAASKSLANLSTGIKGTARYLAYELIASSDSKHSKETDVWAFGMTVFELLARQRPYEGSLEGQALAAIMRRELPQLPEVSTHSVPLRVRKLLWNICQLCWELEPSYRADMGLILKRLSEDQRDDASSGVEMIVTRHP